MPPRSLALGALLLAACGAACSGAAPGSTDSAGPAPPVKPGPVAATTTVADTATTATATATAAAPECASWPRSMAFVHLKNEGRVVNEATARVRRLASERTGPDRYRQVYLMSFVDTAGAPIEVVTVSDASHDECSMSGVQVYVVSRAIGDEPDHK